MKIQNNIVVEIGDLVCTLRYPLVKHIEKIDESDPKTLIEVVRYMVVDSNVDVGEWSFPQLMEVFEDWSKQVEELSKSR